MRMTQLFSQTLREPPAETEIESHRLLLRAGFIRQLAAGIFSYLPLARRSLNHIESIMRQEIDAIGGQEITMPVIHPADLWKESQRWYEIGFELGRFKDKNDHDMVLAMTHEEVIADLVRREVRSYRQLPRLLYHVQTKWRDDPRPRAGLIRSREFTMKDSYSLDVDEAGLDRQYRTHYQTYFNIFNRCQLPVIAVSADVGMMGGYLAHEFMYLTPIGEDTLLLCDQCGYSANRQIARFRKPLALEETLLPIEEVPTPGTKTIEDLANYLGFPKSKTAKAVFVVATFQQSGNLTEQLVFAIVRGDMEVNETKLVNALKARELRPATEDEIRLTGAEPGYASPVGLVEKPLAPFQVVVDEAVPDSPNLVAGANREGYHLINVNYGRDYSATLVADITSAQEGDLCPKCVHPMHAARGVEVGNIFKLGTRFSDVMGCNFQDKDGQEKPVVMGSYGIGSGRLLACIAEHHHDDAGLVWPVSVAPFPAHLVLLPDKGGSGKVTAAAEELYQRLRSTGIEALFDEREDSPGVKFNDADLIGLPLRLTVSERSLQNGGVELKRRDQMERSIVPLDETISRVVEELSSLRDQALSKVVSVEYPG